MKKAIFTLQILILLFFIGCKKKDSSTPIQETAQIPTGGLANFNAALLNLSSDTTTLSFMVTIASGYSVSSYQVITIGTDDTRRMDYNSTGGVQYDAMPTNGYEILFTSDTINAGTNQVTFSVNFYRNKIDPTKNFMLPISIMNAQGLLISTNYSTIYYHSIGNPLSGIYDNIGTRTAYTGPVSGGVIASVDSCPSPKTIIPESALISDCDFADLGPSGWKYIINWNGETLTVTPNNVMAASIAPGSYQDLGSTYDIANKILHLKTQYTNTIGDDRVVDEVLTRQ